MQRIQIQVALVGFCLLGVTPNARAQSVAAGLSALLTEQTPPPSGFVRDRAAAEATFGTVAGLFTIELTSIPVASSAGGFVYRFSPTLGTVERSSDSFGPFFTERSLRNGRQQFSVGLTYQFANFKTLQGADLTAGTFPTNAARFANQLQPFSVDTLSLDLDVETVTAFASYGVTDRLDVGVVVPITRLHFSGQRVNTFQGTSTLQSAQSGSASGLGDLLVNARYRLTESAGNGIAIGSDLRFPTGEKADLLGTGKAAWRLLGIGSWELAPVTADVNGGFSVGGVSREAVLGRGGHLRGHAEGEPGWRADGSAFEQFDPCVGRLPTASGTRGRRDHALASDRRWFAHGVFGHWREGECLWALAAEGQPADAAHRDRTQGPAHAGNCD